MINNKGQRSVLWGLGDEGTIVECLEGQRPTFIDPATLGGHEEWLFHIKEKRGENIQENKASSDIELTSTTEGEGLDDETPPPLCESTDEEVGNYWKRYTKKQTGRRKRVDASPSELK